MSDVTCRGSFALGTACGKCSRCRREIESYNAMKSLRDKLNTPSSALETTRKQADRIKELEAKLAKAERALRDVSQSLDWNAHGACRGWSNGLMAPVEALNKARATLEELKGTDQ